MPDKSKRDKYTFKAPEGVDIEGKKPGDTFEAVVEFEVKEGGKLCVEKINGLELPDSDKDEDESEENPAKSTFVASMG